MLLALGILRTFQVVFYALLFFQSDGIPLPAHQRLTPTVLPISKQQIPMITTPEITFALNAVRRAALLVQQIQSEMVSDALTKGDKSPVTIADFAAQALVSQMLLAQYPNDPLVGEEDSAALQTPEERPTLEQITAFVRREISAATPESVCRWIDHGRAANAPRFWTLDPIDGTKGFLRGDQYAVAFALIVDGAVQIGVLGCPNLTDAATLNFGGRGSLVFAARGQGTWVTTLHGDAPFKQLRVSSQADVSQARILRSFESGHTNADKIDEMAAVLGIHAEPVRMDSQAKYALMAAGAGELMLRLLSPKQPNYREKIWDQAAGSLVIEEAGGRVSDLSGKPFDFSAGRELINNRGVLASNGRLHAAALGALAQIGA